MPIQQPVIADAAAALIFLGIIAYAVLGGADFGGGVWVIFSRGKSEEAKAEQELIAHAIGPVWEANNVWLIYVLVVTWTAFPIVYASISTALFVPIVLALLGIILRGAAFGFRSQFGYRAGIASAFGRVFSVASLITPFLLGCIAGAISGGQLRIPGNSVNPYDYLGLWTTPFALACGCFAVGLCSVLAATYLSVEALDSGQTRFVELFRRRAIIAGAVTAALGAIAGGLASAQSPILWSGLIGKALFLSLGAVIIGLLTAGALLRRRYRIARLLVAAETACILAAWGVAQYPYLIIPQVTISNAASPYAEVLAVVISSLLGMLVLFPSLWYLFRVFKGAHERTPRITAAQLADDGLARAFAEGATALPSPPPGHRAEALEEYLRRPPRDGDHGDTGSTATPARRGRLRHMGATAVARHDRHDSHEEHNGHTTGDAATRLLARADTVVRVLPLLRLIPLAVMALGGLVVAWRFIHTLSGPPPREA